MKGVTQSGKNTKWFSTSTWKQTYF